MGSPFLQVDLSKPSKFVDDGLKVFSIHVVLARTMDRSLNYERKPQMIALKGRSEQGPFSEGAARIESPSIRGE